ncbi:MAG: chromosome segregation protein SMC [Acidimicrobiia bacterium]|nr:chromosome segregation protein SMC [Acidimicrobiia bacterium]
MHLKTLTLVGFKSFADRTRLECEPGVTVVVGPNGTGKSNLVDALAWVMGTQATSVLRTQRMEDVIFAGTATRPALGRAEVSLTFDNSDGRLPLDVPEVTITRRLYRDGTSDYEINGTSCRLLDIQEMLSDSGVGRHQHVIVGQGRVDAVLNAGPEEHRAVIEEAAGVIKHRLRRDRSLRRLEATDIDLARLQDLLGEQQRRMGPLRRQARAAERHEALKEEWRALRLWVGGEHLRTIEGRLQELGEVEGGTRARLDAALAEKEGLVEALARLHQAVEATGRLLERDTAAAAHLETVSERLQRIAMVARERRGALQGRAEGAGQRRRDLEEERADLRTRLAATAEEEALARADAQRHEAARRALEDEERSLAEQGRLPAEGVVATLRGDLAALEAAAQRDEGEALALDERRALVAAQVAAAAAELERLSAEVDALREQAEPAAEAARRAAERSREAQVVLDEARRGLAEARLAEAAAEARVEALEAAVAGLGDPESRRRAAALAGVLGPVVARLDVPAPLAAAVDAALGPWSEAFAVAAPEVVPGAVSSLKASGLGGAAFAASGGVAGEAAARVVAAEAGIDALVDLLGPEADAPLAAALLGDVVVVEGWAAAWSLVQRHPGLRAVTPDGDLVTSFGVRAASPDGAGPTALEAARVALERARVEAARASSRHNAARRSAEDTAIREESTAAQARRLEARLPEAAGGLERAERAAGEGSAELARLDARRAALGEAGRTRRERLALLRPQIEAFEGEEAARQAAWEALARRREDVAARREGARRAGEEAAGLVATAVERRRLLERRLEEVHRLLEDLTGDQVDPGEVERLADIEQRARRGLEAARRHLEVLRERQRVRREQAGVEGHELTAAQEQREALEAALTADREALSAAAIEAAALAVRLEGVAEGLRRDVDASEEKALAAPQPELPQGVVPEEHLESLEAEIRRIGLVNPLAAAEYQELAERAAFLEGQLADLEGSRRELRKVIAALDEEIARLFREACDDIGRRFEENVGVLFPGGRGRLRLTDPDDALASGVEIHVQPMGKKISRLAMLSGGERSLAALAFLFAVFRARPSPFYVLDEVEAALDDTNLRRFIRLVGSLRDTSQLVIITHQQQTMEAADMLYGVTMEPGESSRVLAKRLEREARPAEDRREGAPR